MFAQTCWVNLTKGVLSMLDLKALLSKICKALGFVDIQTYNIDGGFTVRRIWHIINISYNGNVKAYTHSAWNTITTLPVGQRPSANVNFVVAENNTSSAATFGLQGRVLTSGEVQVWVFGNSPSNNQPYFNVTYVVNGGGYLTSKFSNIFSHLERWWEHVRFEGFTCEDINNLVWFGGIKRFLSTCKQQCNDGQHCANALYQIARRSLFSSLCIRNQNHSNQNRFSGSKNSGQSSHTWFYRPVFLHVGSKWKLSQLLWQQSRLLAKCYGDMECKHRISCLWRSNNVRHRGYHIIPHSNGGGMSNVGFESITRQNTQRNYPYTNNVVELHHGHSKHLGKIWQFYNSYCGVISSACWVQQFCRIWNRIFGNIVELYMASNNHTRKCYGWLNRHRDVDRGWNIFNVDEVPNGIKKQFYNNSKVPRTITLERGWCCA